MQLLPLKKSFRISTGFNFYISFVSLFFSLSFVFSQRVQSTKPVYETNETIKLRYNDLPGNEGDWIAVAKRGTILTEYEEYDWTNGIKSGVMSFSGLEAGSYELRVYYNWPKGGYNVELKHEFSVRNMPDRNLSTSIETSKLNEEWDMPGTDYPWIGLDNNDKLKVVEETIDELATDKLSEGLTMMSLDWILERMLRERNAEKLARLDAVYKRKFTRLMQNTFGVWKNAPYPKITPKEIEYLKNLYRYKPTFLERRSALVRIAKSVMTFWGEAKTLSTTGVQKGTTKLVRKRIGRLMTQKVFSKVFGPVSTISDLHTIYQFVQETKELKNAWLGALKSMEQMNCVAYDLHAFRSDLSPEEVFKIEALRVREAKYFESQGLTPPIYPPWQWEIDEACSGEKDDRFNLDWLIGEWITSSGAVIKFYENEQGNIDGKILKANNTLTKWGFYEGQVVFKGFELESVEDGVWKHVASHGRWAYPYLKGRNGELYDPPRFDWMTVGPITIFKGESTLNLPSRYIDENKPLQRRN